MADKKDPSAALATLLKPLIEEANRALSDKLVVQNTEVLLALGAINERLSVIETVVSGPKKANPKPRAAKAVPEEGVVATDPVEQVNAVAAAKPAEAAEVFPVNKLIWFKQQWKHPEYRARFMALPGVTEAVNGSKLVQEKTKPEQKLIAEAQLVWAHIKSTNETVFKDISNEHEVAKAKHVAANKPAPDTVEAVTPK
jgi:hypothetical protein